MKYLTKTLQSVLPATILLLTIGATSLTDVMALPRDRRMAAGKRATTDKTGDMKPAALARKADRLHVQDGGIIGACLRAAARSELALTCIIMRTASTTNPYYYGGRQVYVEVNVNGPLPRAEEIYDDLGFH